MGIDSVTYIIFILTINTLNYYSLNIAGNWYSAIANKYNNLQSLHILKH